MIFKTIHYHDFELQIFQKKKKYVESKKRNFRFAIGNVRVIFNQMYNFE